MALSPQPDPYEVIRLGTDTSGRPILVNRRMQAAVDDLYAQLGVELTIVQGAYMSRVPGGGAAASAGYHDEGGCLDWRVWDIGSKGLTEQQVIHAARSVGWALWKRDQAHGGMDEHFHGVLLDDRDAAAGARWQMSEYRAGRDGLSSQGRDYHWRPDPIPTFDYRSWIHGHDQEDDMTPEQEKTLRSIATDVTGLRKAVAAFREGEQARDKRILTALAGLGPEVAATVETELQGTAPGMDRGELRRVVEAATSRAINTRLGSLDEKP